MTLKAYCKGFEGVLISRVLQTGFKKCSALYYLYFLATTKMFKEKNEGKSSMIR